MFIFSKPWLSSLSLNYICVWTGAFDQDVASCAVCASFTRMCVLCEVLAGCVSPISCPFRDGQVSQLCLCGTVNLGLLQMISPISRKTRWMLKWDGKCHSFIFYWMPVIRQSLRILRWFRQTSDPSRSQLLSVRLWGHNRRSSHTQNLEI